MPKTIGYKGFDKDFKCRGMQYEVGKTYEETEAKICECGLHFCGIPRDVFNYYSPGDNSRYALVETEAEVFGSNDDSKKCTTKLTILKELTLAEMIQETVKIALTTCAAVSSTGYGARVSSTGDDAVLSSTGDDAAVSSAGNGAVVSSAGDYAAVSSTGNGAAVSSAGDGAAVSSAGYRARVKVEGANSLACAVGRGSAVSGVVGTWITLAEWSVNSEGYYVPTFVKSFKVDGEKVKADTFYKLENKKLIEVD